MNSKALRISDSSESTFTRKAAILVSCRNCPIGSSSIPMEFIPKFAAPKIEVPAPENGSRNVSPGLTLDRWINLVTRSYENPSLSPNQFRNANGYNVHLLNDGLVRGKLTNNTLEKQSYFP